MDLGNILGQLMQQGKSGGGNRRLEHALGNGGLGGQQGLEGLLGNLLGGGQQSGSTPGAGTQSGGGLGGMLGGLGDMLGGNSGIGGMNNAQVGGIGALAGALLGGGSGAAKGAVGGGALAVLGGLALSALKNWQQNQSATAAPETDNLDLSEPEIQQMTAPETAELCLKGMISAAKADGSIQQDEMQRIVGKLEEGGITDEERQFVMQEMSKPLDIDQLAASVPNRQIAAQVYAASLMAIDVDTQREQAYLEQLASKLQLERGIVQQLHQMVGA